MSKNTISRYLYDYIGIASSGICFVHCLLPPLLLTLNIGLTETPGFNYLFLLFSFFAVFHATQHNDNQIITTFLWIMFGLATIGILFESDYPLLEYLTYFSTLGLVLGHIWNIRYCRKCKQ